MRSKAALILPLFLPLLGALLRCKGAAVSAPAPVVPVKSIIVAADDGGAIVSYSGVVMPAPDRHALLQTPSSLVVEALHVRPGDLVRAGQLLISLRPDQPTGPEGRKADLGLAQATQSRKRTEALVAAGAAPQSQLDEARSVEAQAGAEAAGRRQLAGYAASSSRILAPFAGTVLRVDAVPGQLAQPSQPLVELADLNALQIEILVPQSIAQGLRPGQETGLRCDGCLDGAKGRITRVFPAPDSASLQVPVWITAPGQKLKPGATVMVDASLPGSADALWLPDEAMIAAGNEHQAFVVTAGKAVARPITIGLHNAGRTQVLSGLKPGDRVVVEGGWQLLDGTAVRETESAPAGSP